jgi:hypothetical protein
MDEALLPLSKVELDQLAEALQLEEDVLDEVEDLASEAAQKHLLRQCIVDLLGPSGSLYSSGFKQVKARAKELGLSSEQIKAATVGMADKRVAVLRLILDDALRRPRGFHSARLRSNRRSLCASSRLPPRQPLSAAAWACARCTASCATKRTCA